MVMTSTKTEVPNRTSRHNSTYELFIGVIAIFSLLVMVLIFLLPPSSSSRDILLVLDTGICLIFLFDFFRNLLRASDKKAYMKWGWLDLLGSIPAMPIFRFARLARIGRVVRLVRGTSARDLFRQFLSRRAESALIATILVAVLVITFGSIFILQFESQSNEANILTGEDAIWWSFVTITTVGYGDRFPVTYMGRITAVILMTIGVGIFGVLTSYLSTTFLTPYQKQAGQSQQDEIIALRGDVANLQNKLDAIEDLLRERYT